ncbi:MAG: efflux RND transporter periplasmic adaptor subunit [Treponema sp.]|nr:efflux RND transporter periplasmic adaptor subunit [Treponema sp.]
MAAIFFAALIVVVSLKKKSAPKAETIPAVIIQKPVRTKLVESITINGYVEAKAMIPVVPFVSGTIMKYPVKAGDYVEKNTLLAKIDDEPFRQTMLQAQAAYLAAKSTYDRVDSLFKAGATTQQNYDTAKAQYDASKAQYDLANLQMNYTEVRAPVSGTVLIANQAVGGIGSTGTPMVVLADLTEQVVRLKVPEKYFDLFTLEKDKLEVKITRPAEKGMYEDAVTTATIENIAPYVSPESKNFEVVCRLDEPGERFRPGMFVKVLVAYRTFTDVPVLPLKAKKLDGSFYLYHPEQESVEFVMPENSVSDGENFIVDEKYADSWFVIDGQNFVFDGQKVRLLEKVLEEY